MNYVTDTFKQPTVLAVFVSVGIHLLAFSGLQAATRQTLDPKAPLAVDVVELNPGDIDRLPDFVQQQLATENPDPSLNSSALPSLPGNTTRLNPGEVNSAEFYSQNFNSPYLDSFIGSLPPPPPEGWFSGSSAPVLADPIPLGSPNLAPPPVVEDNLQQEQVIPLPPLTAAKPVAPSAPANPSPAQTPTAIVPPSREETILEEAMENPSIETVDPPSQDLLPSAVSEIQALQDEYRDRYSYDPAGTSMGEATAMLSNLLVEMRSATNQPELVPEAPISDTLAFPDPICPQNAGGVAIVVLVDPQGYVIESQLIRSSGYWVLDDQALASVNQRNFTSQAQGRYTVYQYLISFADLDRVCRVNNARTQESGNGEAV